VLQVTPAVGFFAGPVWGMVADRYRVHKRMLLWTTLLTLAAMQLQYAVAPHHTAIALLVVVAAIFSAPVCVASSPSLPLSQRTPATTYPGVPGNVGCRLFELPWAPRAGSVFRLHARCRTPYCL